MIFYFGRVGKEARSHRVIIRRNNSNQTLNFSLYGCDNSLLELKTIFSAILVEDPDHNFETDINYIEDWTQNRNINSHAITVQDIREKPYKSFTIGVKLHDFDIDEIRNVLRQVFCNMR